MNEMKKKNIEEGRKTEMRGERQRGGETDREEGRWIDRGGGGQRGKEKEKGREE